VTLQIQKKSLYEKKGFKTMLKTVIIALQMITDVQLAVFANMLGVTVFLLVVLYHYIAANNPKSA